MSVRKIYEVEKGAYFYSARLHQGASLFHKAKYRDPVLQSLKWLQDNQRMTLWSFVVMPNHVHFIYTPEKPFSASVISKAFSSFTAHKILAVLKNDTAYRLFKHSAKYRRSTDRQHCIWGSNLLITLAAGEHIRKKIEYVHNNPVRKGWSLCDDRGRYAYSSAMLYDYGEEPVIPVKVFKQ